MAGQLCPYTKVKATLSLLGASKGVKNVSCSFRYISNLKHCYLKMCEWLDGMGSALQIAWVSLTHLQDTFGPRPQ